MSRSLLHKSKLEDFKAWLDENCINHRPGVGDYQVLQVERRCPVVNRWDAIYERLHEPDHLTVVTQLERLVRRYIKERKCQKT